jgi:hypothetical protein
MSFFIVGGSQWLWWCWYLIPSGDDAKRRIKELRLMKEGEMRGERRE